MENQYVKQCPYCNSTENSMVFSSSVARMVSKCDDCGYTSNTIFHDIEATSVVKQVNQS